MEPGEDSDEVLMSRYRDGEVAAFDRLYDRHRGAVFRFLLRQVRERALAEELFQEVWIAIVRGRRRYRVRARFTTWLYGVAHSRLVDHHRSRTRRRRGLGRAVAGEADALPAPQPAPERVLDAERRVARLLVLLDALPAEQREAFLLREEGGLDVDAIAQITGVGHETAKSRLRYAVEKLRAGLEEDGDDQAPG